MNARSLCVLGTSSSAGKSLLTTAFCRIFARRGICVAPFKAQNMSNNAAVCRDGSEIGRAQAVQALAAGIPLNADFNPVLIKPEADARSQVIVMGQPFKTLTAADYYNYKDELWKTITSALDRLLKAYDLLIIEGAGSPVELNLRSGDIVNMAVARYAKSSVVLVGDIDRGGIFSQLLGTLWLLEPEERSLVRGLLVNKFRGDPALFAEGINILEERSELPVLGVVPYLRDLRIPEEDAVPLETVSPSSIHTGTTAIEIAVIHLPRISNFDDFDPLASEPDVNLRYVRNVNELGKPQAIILPGTKSTTADLEWLHISGLAERLLEFVRAGGVLVGICGGYQMLGKMIQDPERVESQTETVPGLDLLPLTTVFSQEKTTHQVKARICLGLGWLAGVEGAEIEGYEIHMGRSRGGTTWLELERDSGGGETISEGAISPDGHIWGCYLHGLFMNPRLRHAWLKSLGWCRKEVDDWIPNPLQTEFDRLADAVEEAVDIRRLEKILWGS